MSPRIHRLGHDAAVDGDDDAVLVSREARMIGTARGEGEEQENSEHGETVTRSSSDVTATDHHGSWRWEALTAS